MRGQVKDMAQAFGFKERSSPNQWMDTYVLKDETKKYLDYYFTTNTVVFNEPGKNCKVLRNISITDLEKLLT